MLRIIYFSAETGIFSTELLRMLLVQSREDNARLGITGLLLYMHGNFFQVIEGEDASVKKLFDSIRRDDRHRRVICLSEEPASEREFPDWAMGFENLDGLWEGFPLSCSELSNFHSPDPNWGVWSESVQRYIRAFWIATR